MAAKPDIDEPTESAKPEAPTVESLMDCPICLGHFDDPRVLPCLHTLCRKCLHDHISATVKDGNIVCPSCRHECRVPQGGASAVPKNFLLNSLREILQQQSDQPADSSASEHGATAERTRSLTCGGYSSEDQAQHGEVTVFCMDCSCFYCESCQSSHRIFRLFRDHHLVPVTVDSASTVQAAESKRKVPRCEKHPAREMDIYCDTCQVPVCTTCCLLQHQQHSFRELVEVGKESRSQLTELVQAANKHTTKLIQHSQHLALTEGNIHQDSDKARKEVQQAASAMRDLVSKREQKLLKRISKHEANALLEVNASRKNTELNKISTQSLRSYMESLQESGDVTNQVVHTPGLREQLRQQEAAPLRSVTWAISFKEETQSVAALDAMLGTVSFDQTATTPAAAGDDFELSARVKTLKPDVQHDISGIAVVGGCLCVVGWGQPYLWIHNNNTNRSRKHTIVGLRASGMAATDSNTLVIADSNRKLHFITISQQHMDIECTFKDIGFEPRRLSVDASSGNLVIVNCSANGIMTCDSNGILVCSIKVNTTIRSMWCAVAIIGGYVVLDNSSTGKLHWVDIHGNVTHTYDESLRWPWDVVEASQGCLLVADMNKNRLHLIGANRKLSQYLLSQEDDIKHPTCLYLNEGTSRLCVAHAKGKEIRVYKWPTAAPPTDTHHTHHRLCVKTSKYK